jgi:beta-lactam-binding protein with PASTA domain
MAPAPVLTVPSVVGKTLAQAEQIVAAAGFTVSAQGDDVGGPITMQLPAAEAEVEKGWTGILVWFTEVDDTADDDDPSAGLIASI